MAGWRATLAIWPALLVCGGSFAVVQFATANYHGPWLVDVAGGLVSLICLSLFLRVWQPRTIWRFPDEPQYSASAHARSLTRRQIAYAWVPWALLSMLVFLWGGPSFRAILNGGDPSHPNPLAGVSK